jgi:hypothetical protein
MGLRSWLWIWSAALGGGLLLAAICSMWTMDDLPTGDQTGTDNPSQPTSRLSIEVRVIGRGSAAPRPEAPPVPPPDLGPASGAVVRAVPAGSPGTMVAEAIADGEGRAALDLPPGRYWVLVPYRQEVPGLPGAPASGTNLPTGEPVLAWAEAETPAASELSLRISVALV